MATNPELLKADDSVKWKYLDIVANLPVKELKKLKKTENQKLVLIDLMELLPDFDKSQLKMKPPIMCQMLSTVQVK